MADVGVARRGRARLVLLGVGVLLVLYLASSLMWPNVVPRVALLPRPARTSWYDGCNWHGRSYERGAGIFWIYVEDQTTRACPEGGLPEDDALRGSA